MKLLEIVKELDNKFKKDTIKEDWTFVDPNLKEVGLIYNFSDEIEKIYTTCFPSQYVLDQILDQENILLISHHPFDWNPYKSEVSFLQWKKENLEKMKNNKISFYAAHLMWDNARCDGDGLFSTTTAFPKTIGMQIERTYLEEPDKMQNVECGLIGTHEIKELDKLVEYIKSITKHPINVIKNNNEQIKKIAYIPGGGTRKEYIINANDSEINTYITGNTRAINNYHKDNFPDLYNYLKQSKINLIGVGHYFTEKWAPLLSIPYFEKFAPAEFIEDVPKNDLLD